MEKLPVSLVMIVCNAADRLEAVISHHRSFVSEVVVLDQGSTDGTYEVAEKLADLVVRRRHKGYCEPDREYAFSLAKHPYVLNLDDDEFLSPEAVKALGEAVKTDADIFWFKRHNYVDGISIKEIMGEDPQCRFFKRGAVRYSDTMHKYPEPAINTKVFYLDTEIEHRRTLEGLKKANKARNRVADPEVVKMQDEFVQAVEDFLKKPVEAK